jgi:hypothetical protein
VERVRRLRQAHAAEDDVVAAALSEVEREGLLPPGPARGDLAMSVRGVIRYLAQREGAT